MLGKIFSLYLLWTAAAAKITLSTTEHSVLKWLTENGGSYNGINVANFDAMGRGGVR